LTRKFAHTFSISETEWCQRATFPARMLADTAPAEVPTMMGKGQSGRGCICASAFEHAHLVGGARTASRQDETRPHYSAMIWLPHDPSN
jgi:hypothetical protein